MTSPLRFVRFAILLAWTVVPLSLSAQLPRGAREIPEALRGWEDWATWDYPERACPTPYDEPSKPLCFWPSRLTLAVDRTSGHFELETTVFSESWVPLPGDADTWPREVKVNGLAQPVVEHGERPSLKLPAGTHRIEGIFEWNEEPRKISMPSTIGILALTLDGVPVESPVWADDGILWLRRSASTEAAETDFLGVKVYSVLEDGIPLWLRTEIELIVSGRNREEQIGSILPEGWKLAAVDSRIPVAIDDAGRMKVQVRPGKWTILVDAFRLDNPKEIRYSPEAKPAVADELIAFRADPSLRLVEVTGAPAVDVSQTTLPERWRDLPVFRWETSSPLRLEERMRGMGSQRPEGLRIRRSLWLDESGRGLTFRDEILGSLQQIWRLDTAAGQELGSVRNDGQGLLVTRNPSNGAAGVEIRSRNINLQATGRIEHAGELPASGWQADADALNVTLNLPPGWRLLALFGADWVRGDWLTAWSLLDLFLLLIFALAVFRLWGLGAAALALLAFGLSYQEPGAPRYVWLVLLMPLALLRVVPAGWAQRLVIAWKWLAIAALVLLLVPFLARQVQQALYPQLEAVGAIRSEPPPPRPKGYGMGMGMGSSGPPAEASEGARAKSAPPAAMAVPAPALDSNLMYQPSARIQTGPGVPEWTWRVATLGWNGPVLASQKVHPILIPQAVERALTVLRVALLLALAYVLLKTGRTRSWMFGKSGGMAALVASLVWTAPAAQAQFPDRDMLNTLGERLLTPSDAYPNAADIPSVLLRIDNRRMTIEADVHAAIRTAVPLPGNLPAWTPSAVFVDGKPEVSLRRDKNYLWIVVPEGVHKIRVEGVLSGADEWQWTFALKPRQVTIEAPEWTVSGVRSDGVPEQQIFFVRKDKSTAGQASYERQEFQTVAAVERNLQLGLVWQVQTTVSRLSPDGRAIAIRVPLLAGEKVLSANAVVRDGLVEVRLGANDGEFSWESELPVTSKIELKTKAGDPWVERWHVLVSPVWNLAISGLAPTFEPVTSQLVPVWQPWPGESTELTVSRPEAIAGATVTVDSAKHDITLGKRQRVSQLNLSVRSSLGEDFQVDLPAAADISSLSVQGKTIPVRKDGTKLIIPLQPGEQSISVGWKASSTLGFFSAAEEIKLPVASANIETTIHVPSDRWILWTHGPLRGPAVRFWSILVCALIAAWVLGRLANSPLRSAEWMLLAIGLTQVPLPAALGVIGWLFFLVWRGRASFLRLPAWGFNVLQIFLIVLTAGALAVFVAVVAAGLLGNPEMFVLGNGSHRTLLRWYQARCEAALPTPGCASVSIWWYRFLMLAWALWLAASLIRWLRWAWGQFSTGGCFRR
ncbi:MAG TPA: hypothetical protein VIT18_06720, partial [Terrimicrobiaceae bacterium]